MLRKTFMIFPLRLGSKMQFAIACLLMLLCSSSFAGTPQDNPGMKILDTRTGWYGEGYYLDMTAAITSADNCPNVRGLIQVNNPLFSSMVATILSAYNSGHHLDVTVSGCYSVVPIIIAVGEDP